MADRAKVVGDVVVETAQSVRNVGDLSRAVSQAGNSFAGLQQRAGSSLDAIATGLAKFNLAIAGIQTALRLAGEAIGTVKFAAEARQLDSRMRELGLTADDLSKAVGGSTDKMSLMKFALKQVQGESALTKAQMLLVLEAAEALNDRGFGDTIEIAESLAKALKGGSTKALIDYNIKVDDTLPKQERVNDLFREFQRIANSPVNVDPQLEAIERLQAATTDWIDSIKRGFGEATMGVWDFIVGVDRMMQRDLDDAWHVVSNPFRGGDYGPFGKVAAAQDLGGIVRGAVDSAQASAAQEAALTATVNRYASQFETALRNRPAGWYDELTGEVYLSMRQAGRAVARGYEKVASRRPGEYTHSYAEAVGMRQTYGDAFFDAAMSGTYSGSDQQVMSDAQFRQRLADFETKSTLEKLKAPIFAELAEATRSLEDSNKDLSDNEIRIEQYEQMHMWMTALTPATVAFADALMSGGNAFTALARGLQQGLRALAIDSAVKALYALGEGFLFGKPNAFAAAAKYTAAAAAAGAGSAAIGALVGGSGAGTASSPTAGGFAGPTLTGSGDGGGLTINVQGNLYGDPAAFGRAIADAVDKAARAGSTRPRGNRWQ